MPPGRLSAWSCATSCGTSACAQTQRRSGRPGTAGTASACSGAAGGARCTTCPVWRTLRLVAGSIGMLVKVKGLRERQRVGNPRQLGGSQFTGGEDAGCGGAGQAVGRQQFEYLMAEMAWPAVELLGRRAI